MRQGPSSREMRRDANESTSQGRGAQRDYGTLSPREAHDRTKESVAKAVSNVAGAIEGFADAMARHDLSHKTKQAVERLGQAARRLTSSASSELSQTRTTITGTRQRSQHEEDSDGSGELVAEDGGLRRPTESKRGAMVGQAAPDLPATQANTAEMRAGKSGGSGRSGGSGMSSGNQISRESDMKNDKQQEKDDTEEMETGRQTRIENTGPEGTTDYMGPRAYPKDNSSLTDQTRQQTGSYEDADKDLNADRKFDRNVGWDDDSYDDQVARGEEKDRGRENLPSRSMH